MTAWQRTYQKCQADLDCEAEDHNGVISQKALEQIVSKNVGKDRRRTIPDAIEQLKAAFVLEPINQYSYRYMMDGWREKAKVAKDKEIAKELEVILGARV